MNPRSVASYELSKRTAPLSYLSVQTAGFRDCRQFADQLVRGMSA
jgi:hypothetical protein